jgi:hypothetical protein
VSWEDLDAVLERFDLACADAQSIQALRDAVGTFRSGLSIRCNAESPTLSRTTKLDLIACATGLRALHQDGRSNCRAASLLRHGILKDLTAQSTTVIAEYAGADRFDVYEVRDLIQRGTESPLHLDALVEIVEKVPSPKSGRRENRWPPLASAALAVWSAAGRSERYSNRAESGVSGPLVEFLREVLTHGLVRPPTDYALRDFIAAYKL